MFVIPKGYDDIRHTKRAWCLSYQKDIMFVIPKGCYICHTKRVYLSYQSGLTFVIPKGFDICHTKREWCVSILSLYNILTYITKVVRTLILSKCLMHSMGNIGKCTFFICHIYVWIFCSLFLIRIKSAWFCYIWFFLPTCKYVSDGSDANSLIVQSQAHLGTHVNCVWICPAYTQ